MPFSASTSRVETLTLTKPASTLTNSSSIAGTLREDSYFRTSFRSAPATDTHDTRKPPHHHIYSSPVYQENSSGKHPQSRSDNCTVTLTSLPYTTSPTSVLYSWQRHTVGQNSRQTPSQLQQLFLLHTRGRTSISQFDMGQKLLL